MNMQLVYRFKVFIQASSKLIGHFLTIGLLALAFSSPSLALNDKGEMVREGLPTVQFLSENVQDHFHIYGAKRRNFVIVQDLASEDLSAMRKISDRANRSYTRITESGDCPSYRVNSGSLGYISSKQGGDSIDFEVICSDNETALYISLRDKFVMSYVLYKVSPEQFSHWLNDIESKMSYASAL